MKLKKLTFLALGLTLLICSSCESPHEANARLRREAAERTEESMKNPKYVGMTPDGRKITCVTVYRGNYHEDRVYTVEGAASMTTNTTNGKYGTSAKMIIIEDPSENKK